MPAPKKRFCLRGHDASVTGRYESSGACIECQRRKDNGTTPKQPRQPDPRKTREQRERVPIEGPGLARFLAGHGLTAGQMATRAGLPTRVVQRAVSEGRMAPGALRRLLSAMAEVRAERRDREHRAGVA